MCRSASDYRFHARTSSKPVRTPSKPGRSLVEVLRDLFRPRRPQVQEAEVVPFPAGSDAHAAQKADRKGPKAA